MVTHFATNYPVEYPMLSTLVDLFTFADSTPRTPSVPVTSCYPSGRFDYSRLSEDSRVTEA